MPVDLSRLVRGLLALIAFAFTPLIGPGLAQAHEGHDHGAKPVAQAPTAAPRLVLQSETYQFVAILKDGDLKIFLDLTADNSPVTNAALSLSIGDATLDAKPTADGAYLVEGGPLRKAGQYEVIATISGPSGDDLLIGSLVIPGLQGDVRPQAQQTNGVWLASFPLWSYALGLFLGGISWVFF